MLFGHQNDDKDKPAQDSVMNGVNPLAVDPDTGASLPVAPEAPASDTTPSSPVLDQPAADSASSTAPAVPDNIITPAPDSPASDAPALEPAAATDSAPAAAPSSDPSQPAASDDDLLNLKQQALQQLSPLVDHLDQTPEEKFHTTMMMIRSSDNQALIKDAYAAAQDIADDKVRAQALLDIVNEINYFTQKP